MSQRVTIEEIDSIENFCKQFDVTIANEHSAILNSLRGKYKDGGIFSEADGKILKSVACLLITTNPADAFQDGLWDSMRKSATSFLKELESEKK